MPSAAATVDNTTGGMGSIGSGIWPSSAPPPVSQSIAASRSVAPPPLTVAPSASPQPPAAPQSTTISPQAIAAYFQQKGLTPDQAQGVASAIMGESGGNALAYNPQGGNLGAYGLAQDRAARQKKLIELYGPTPTPKQQLDFIWYELNTSEKGALDAIKGEHGADAVRQAFSNHFERPSLQSQWAQPSPEESENIKQYQEQTQRLQSQLVPMMQQYAAQINKQPEGSAARQQLIAELQQNSAEMMKEWREKVMNPPAATPMENWHNVGSVGFILAALAGLFSRQHITAGLTAGAAALNAMAKNNNDEYNRQYKIWKDQTEMGAQMIQMNNSQIRDILADEKMAVDEKNVRLQQLASELGLQTQLGSMSLNPIEYAGKYLQMTDKAMAQMQLASSRLQEAATLRAWSPIYNPDGTVSEVNMLTGEKRDLGAIQQGSLKFGGSQVPTPPPLQYPDKWPGMPDKPPTGVAPDIWSLALNWVRTGTSPPLGWGNNQQRQQFIQAVPAAQHALGVTPSTMADVQAAFVGERHGEIVAGGRAGQLGLAVEEAKRFVPEAMQASKAVNRTQYPTLNAIMLAWERGTGDQNVVALAGWANALANVAAQIASRGGQNSVEARRTAYERLSTAYSQGQFDTAANVIMREAEVASGAPAAAAQDIRQIGRTPGMVQPTETAPPQSSGRVVIQNGWRYDAQTHQPLGPVQ